MARACRVLGAALLGAALLAHVRGHTWLYTLGRATMEAAVDKPFRARKMTAGQGTHAQLGPGQEMVVRWASSHNNTFMLAVLSAQDQDVLYDDNYYRYLDDYLDNAPNGTNYAKQRPRYHGGPRAASSYVTKGQSQEACADGYCAKIFTGLVDKTSPAYIGHFDDMSAKSGSSGWTHGQYAFEPAFLERADDKAVTYKSAKYPWLLAAYRYHNLVNMHHEWDLVTLGIPDLLENIKARGQHYLVHFSSRNAGDRLRHVCGGDCYNDVVDVHALPEQVDASIMYGDTTGQKDWVKIDHCQFINPLAYVSPIRNATLSAEECRVDMDRKHFGHAGINVVPTHNPHVVKQFVTRAVETVNPVCDAACFEGTSGQCKAVTANKDEALCHVPAKVWAMHWENPAVSGKGNYEPLKGRVGEYVEWTWDDVFHDVWLMDDGTAARDCDFTRATQLFKAIHHSFDAPGGRAVYKIPEDAVDGVLHFACGVKTHCQNGQAIRVDVEGAEEEPDAGRLAGICNAGYELCPDDAQQGKTSARVKTAVNIPFGHPRAAESLRLGGTVTRAATPWAGWAASARRRGGVTCQPRRHDKGTGHLGLAGTRASDYGLNVWDWERSTLRDVVEACSSNYPEHCVGVAWFNGVMQWHNLSSAVATQSSTINSNSAYAAGRATDGDPATFTHTVAGAHLWWQAVLPSALTITAVRVTNRLDCCGHRLRDFTITVGGVVCREVKGPQKLPVAEHTCDRAITGTTVRIEMNNTGGGSYLHIGEVEVMTQTAAVADPSDTTADGDMYTGEHYFRRCLETDGYTRVVKVGTSATPTVTVPCAGCYQCREVKHAPVPTASGHTSQAEWYKRDFRFDVQDSGAANATVRVTLRTSYGADSGDLAWPHHDLEIVCRVDARTTALLPPDLATSAGWTTFLRPVDQGTDLEALAAGFGPGGTPTLGRGVATQANVAAVYTPGPQVDRANTTGPWADDANRLTDLRAPPFTVDYNSSSDYAPANTSTATGRVITINQQNAAGGWEWTMAAEAPHEGVVGGTASVSWPTITLRMGDTVTFKGRVQASHNFALKGPGTRRGPFNLTPMGVNSISPARLHVHPMGRTCR